MSDYSPIYYLILTALCTIAIVIAHQVPKPAGLYKKRHRAKLKFSTKLFAEPVKYCKDCGNIWHGKMQDTACNPIKKRCSVRIFSDLYDEDVVRGRSHRLICSDHHHWSDNLKDCGRDLVNWKDIINSKPLVFPTLHVM